MTNPKNILIRAPNWIGDAVMGAPLASEIKKKFPDTKITLMCQGAVGQLFLYDPNIDEVLSFKKSNGWIHHITSFPLIDPLKKGGYDCGILLTNSLSSAWWFYRAGIKNRIGFQGQGRSFLLNHAVPFPENLESEHLVKVYKQLLTPLNIIPSNILPKLYLKESEILEAQHLLKKGGANLESRFIGINPGAAYGSAKCWLPERFRQVIAELLKDPKNTILIFGDASTKSLTEQISQGLGERVFNLAGRTTLRELMAIISLLDVLLTNDSGPMHIASALKTPLVALFGSTNEIKTGPLDVNSQVIRKTVYCSPCYQRVCPIDFRCMKNIEVEEVVQKLNDLIQHKR